MSRENMWIQLLLSFHFVSLSVELSCPNGMTALTGGLPCIRDSGCDMQTPGYKCYNGVCCTSAASDDVNQVGYGHYCTSTFQCQYLNSECQSNICLCQSRFSYDGQICSSSIGTRGVPYHAYCTADVQCKPDNSACIENKCECLRGFFYVGESCVRAGDVEYGGYCTSTSQCKTSKSGCIGNTCACPIGSVYNGGSCNNPGGVEFGGRCTQANQCKTSNSECMSNVCACPIGSTYTGDSCWSQARPEQPGCTVSTANVELRNGSPVNCLYEDCSRGYYCEFTKRYRTGQYICCGEPIGRYGKVKVFPQTNSPLECNTPTSCRIFKDTPYCVYSRRFNQRVCCSTFTC